MAKIKKSFDKELMYKKIMPTNLKKNAEQEVETISNNSNIKEISLKETSISINANAVYINEKSMDDGKEELKEEIKTNENNNLIIENKEISVKERKGDGFILYNIMERLVMEKLDITLNKMSCCKCDRCKEDIVALALNSLKPMYIVANENEINNKIKELNKLGLEVTTAVLKAVLAIRKSPRH